MSKGTHGRWLRSQGLATGLLRRLILAFPSLTTALCIFIIIARALTLVTSLCFAIGTSLGWRLGRFARQAADEQVAGIIGIEFKAGVSIKEINIGTFVYIEIVEAGTGTILREKAGIKAVKRILLLLVAVQRLRWSTPAVVRVVRVQRSHEKVLLVGGEVEVGVELVIVGGARHGEDETAKRRRQNQAG